MTTRNGTTYILGTPPSTVIDVDREGGAQFEEGGSRSNVTRQQDSVTELSRMMQVMLEDRQRREDEQREERRRWELERQQRELEFLEEKRKRLLAERSRPEFKWNYYSL